MAGYGFRHMYKLSCGYQAGAGEFNDGRWPFEIPIPPDENKRGHKHPKGAFGAFTKTLDMLGDTRRRTNWYVKGKLDIPMGFDVSASQDIVIK